jgi:hypothetical protein
MRGLVSPSYQPGRCIFLQLAGRNHGERREHRVFFGGGRFRGRGFWCGAQLFLAGIEPLITLMALMFFWGLVVAVSFVVRLPALAMDNCLWCGGWVAEG